MPCADVSWRSKVRLQSTLLMISPAGMRTVCGSVRPSAQAGDGNGYLRFTAQAVEVVLLRLAQRGGSAGQLRRAVPLRALPDPTWRVTSH